MMRGFLSVVQWLSWAAAALVIYAVADRYMAGNWSPAIESLVNNGAFLFGLGGVCWLLKKKM